MVSNVGRDADDQSNRIKSAEVHPHMYEQMIFDKATNIIQGRKDTLFNKQCWDKWISICTNINYDPWNTPSRNINSNCIMNLKIKAKIIKLLDENTSKNFCALRLGEDFLDMTSKAKPNHK